MAQVFKARYFRNKLLLEATKGFRPSYMWSSIMESKWLFEDGCQWRIGNGVMEDKWVPNLPEDRIPFHEGVSVKPNMTLSELFGQDGGTWNSKLFSLLFSPSTMACIRAIPIKLSWTNDWLYWCYNNNGIYSVKSGYHLTRMKLYPIASSSLVDEKQRSLVWDAEALPMCKHFIWRTCIDILPVKF